MNKIALFSGKNSVVEFKEFPVGVNADFAKDPNKWAEQFGLKFEVIVDKPIIQDKSVKIKKVKVEEVAKPIIEPKVEDIIK